jgi:hypothetical protein
MTTHQNFDFVDYKVRVNYVDLPSSLSTEYISRICLLKEDPALVMPPATEEGKDSRSFSVAQDFTYTYAMDIGDARFFPELEDYFYHETNKTVDVLIVGDIADMSRFMEQQYMDVLNGRCYTMVVDSSLDDLTIDPNFITRFKGAFLVTRQEPEQLTEKFGKLIINDEDAVIRTSELLKFSGWLFNRADFLGQVTIRSIDYMTEFWLNYQGLTDLSENKNIGFGNQDGTTYVSCFYIGDKGGMDFYRLEQIKRDIQSAILKVLNIRNNYDQQTLSTCESATKNSINKHTFCDATKTIVKVQKLSMLPSEITTPKIIPIIGTIGFYQEADRAEITLYNISTYYGTVNL